MTDGDGILFLAFEHSGDERAAPVIARLRQKHPQWPIWALGGPKMERAGAQILEHSTEKPSMLLEGALQLPAHVRRLMWLRRWLRSHRLAVAVPVDSPAANFSCCRLVRRYQPQASIAHLVAPQLWAWAPWRIGKLRKLTDHVLCLLPFEPAWFAERGVRSTFVGDPLFDETSAQPMPSGGHQTTRAIALLPGSRAAEIRANWPMMLTAFEQMQQIHGELRGVVAAADEHTAKLIRRYSHGGELPQSIEVRTDKIDWVLQQCDVALVVSGTATLHAAVSGTPMVIIYNLSRWKWHLVGSWLIRTRPLTLPNLICKSLGLSEHVPEFVPHFGDARPIVGELDRLLSNDRDRHRQQDLLAQIRGAYRTDHYATKVTDLILQLAKSQKLGSGSSSNRAGHTVANAHIAPGAPRFSTLKFPH